MTGQQPDYPQRIWFDPPKFWAATRNMTKEEADWLSEKICELAEKQDFETLRRFSFIHIGNYYERKRAS